MHTQNSGRFAVDDDFLQFRSAPKMMMDRKRNWAENETDLKTKIPKTKLVRNWQMCSFGAENENENEIRSVSNHHHHHHHHHHPPPPPRHRHHHRHVGNEKLLEVACIVTEFPNAKILAVLSVHASIPKDISRNIAVVRVVLEFSNERSLAIVWVITTNGFALFSKVVGSCY